MNGLGCSPSLGGCPSTSSIDARSRVTSPRMISTQLHFSTSLHIATIFRAFKDGAPLLQPEAESQVMVFSCGIFRNARRRVGFSNSVKDPLPQPLILSRMLAKIAFYEASASSALGQLYSRGNDSTFPDQGSQGRVTMQVLCVGYM